MMDGWMVLTVLTAMFEVDTPTRTVELAVPVPLCSSVKLAHVDVTAEPTRLPLVLVSKADSSGTSEQNLAERNVQQLKMFVMDDQLERKPSSNDFPVLVSPPATI